MVRLYIIFLEASALVSILIVGLRTASGDVTGALAYLTASALFLTSVLTTREFYSLIRRARFAVYWMRLGTSGTPYGGYVSLYVITSVLFFTADLLKGGYLPLALLLLFKGFFEYLLDRFQADTMAASFLFYTLETGDLESAEIRDPFR
ncbi:hypothetical protein [Thermococcus zilligii]|uniref:hypothetical protein n=1 Tax=Thermococcus zilligii TaxID=54076 RepID=UPI00029A5091|nr:hypothetical protein [Thermococcus zilligii]